MPGSPARRGSGGSRKKTARSVALRAIHLLRLPGISVQAPGAPCPLPSSCIQPGEAESRVG